MKFLLFYFSPQHSARGFTNNPCWTLGPFFMYTSGFFKLKNKTLAVFFITVP